MNWRPISELREVEADISMFAYAADSKEAKRMVDEEGAEVVSRGYGQVNVYEPLEINLDGDTVVYREGGPSLWHETPETFETQFGTFANHNNGELQAG